MFIWDDGESVTVTGSVDHAVLDAYNKAKDEGGDLSVFAPFLGIVPEPKPEAAEESAAPAPAEALTLADVRAIEAEPAPAEETPAEEPNAYDGWSLAELQDEAESRGLPKYGTKAEIAARLSESGTDEEV